MHGVYEEWINYFRRIDFSSKKDSENSIKCLCLLIGRQNLNVLQQGLDFQKMIDRLFPRYYGDEENYGNESGCELTLENFHELAAQFQAEKHFNNLSPLLWRFQDGGCHPTQTPLQFVRGFAIEIKLRGQDGLRSIGMFLKSRQYIFFKNCFEQSEQFKLKSSAQFQRSVALLSDLKELGGQISELVHQNQ